MAIHFEIISHPLEYENVISKLSQIFSTFPMQNVSKIMLKRFLFLSLWLFGANTMTAQFDDYQFEVYGFEDGLTHRNIYNIQQDPSGFIWIATINGLNKFDGINFVQYSTNSKQNKIPFDFINKMAIDKDGLIYLASPNRTCILNPFEKSHELIAADSLSILKNTSFGLDNIFIDNSNNMWSSTWLNELNSAILIKRNEKGNLENQLAFEGKFANLKITQQGNDFYLAKNDHTILQLNEQMQKINSFSIPSKHAITALQTTNDETVWALTNKGAIFYKSGGNDDFVAHKLNNELQLSTSASSFLVESNGNIWIAGNGILWLYNQSENKLLDFSKNLKSLTKNTSYFRQIFQDNQGVIWLASDFGAIKIVRSDNAFKNYLSGGNENCFNGFCSIRGITGDDDGNIYFSYYNAIHQLNTTTNELTPLLLKHKFSNLPFGLLYHQNALYTGNGLRIDLNTNRVDTLFKRSLIDKGVCIFQEDLIWFGFENKLYQHDPNSNKTKLYKDPKKIFPLIDNEINFLHAGKKSGNIYVGTQTNGIYILNRNQNITHLNSTNDPKISHNRILNIHEDKLGNLWLATANGLNKVNLNKNTVSHFTMENGLPNNFINGLLSEADSCIWVSTDNGLSRYAISNNSFTNFTDKDGLPSNEFNRIACYQSNEGRMYFGGLNGVTSFLPKHFHKQNTSQKEAKLLFTSFSKFNARDDSLHTLFPSGTQKEKLELENADRFFTFNFALADYKNPKGNQYSYKLDGFDPDWSTSSNMTTARFNNIPAGEYTFRVRGATGNEKWNKNELSIPVTIKEAFYKTWWFLTTAFLFALISFYSFFRYRIYMIQQREKKLERLVNSRTSELQIEKQKSDDLLLNILPAETAEELKQFGKAIAKKHDSVSVLFSDFKDFSVIAEQLDPEELVSEIDFCFKEFDLIIEKYQLEKIKTIGDSYMCVGGIEKNNHQAAIDTVKAALEIQQFLSILANKNGVDKRAFTKARIGIHTGPVVSGVVGIKKFAFDIWGDSVNTAARMESEGEVGKVNISETTYQIVKEHFSCLHRGKITAKNKGDVDMYFVQQKSTR